MGKLGSILVLLVLKYGPTQEYAIQAPLGSFSILMALGAFIAWIWLPDVQGPAVGPAEENKWPDVPSKELDLLAKGRKHATDPRPDGEGQVLTSTGKFAQLFNRKNIVEDHEFSAYVRRAQYSTIHA